VTALLQSANLLFLLVAIGAGMSLSEYAWIGVPVSLIAAGLFVWVNWGRPAVRKRRMRKPYYAFFVMPPDETEKDMVTDLHVPPDSEVSVQLRLRPLLHYQHHEVIFGFIGDFQSQAAAAKDAQ
jgi:hypothetical protein